MKKFLLFSLIILVSLYSCSKDNDQTIDANENIPVSLSISDTVLYNGTEINMSVIVDRDIKEARYYFDGESIGTSISKPYSIDFTPNDLIPGYHSIKCIILSNENNEFQDSTIVKLKLRLWDNFQGGIVFHFFSDGLSGLIAAKEDLYINGTDRFFWADNVSIGRNINDGFDNTLKMAENSSNNRQVGYFFKQGFMHNGYDDWYIPAINELVLLKENKNMIGGFSQETNWQGLYWSSSELSETNAEALNFNSLMGNYYGKNSYSLKVRLIRRF